MKGKVRIWGIYLAALAFALVLLASGCSRRPSETGTTAPPSPGREQGAVPVTPPEGPSTSNQKPSPEGLEAVLAKAKAKEVSNACLKNLRELAIAFLQYTDDYDGCFPAADRWADVVDPYIRSTKVLQCPADTDHEYGYAYNRALAGKRLEDVPNPGKTPLVFDSTAGKKNAADYGESWPKAPRHEDANNCAFADGHLERPREKPNFKPQ